MARPCKKRWVCGKPRCSRFQPLNKENLGEVVLNLDEYECIRLIDYEGLEQEQCAKQMGVARTTVQAIYKSAREKLADFLVNGRGLCIEGGDIMMKIQKGGHIEMRIAVTYENGQIFQHFGHTEQFKLYDIADGKVAASEVVDTNGFGHGALAGFLQGNNVDMLICGGIGGGAQMALAEVGIKLFGGVSGSADEAVEALLKQELAYNPNVQCNHHGEGHEHHGNCGNHGCGSHSCH